MPDFHHFSIRKQNQSISNQVICHQNTKAIALLFGHKCLMFITVNLQSKSINVKFGHSSPKYQGYSLCVGHKCLIFITFQSAIKLNQFHICSLFTKIPRLQPYFFSTNASFSSLFNLQSKSINFKGGYLSPKYQAYSLTFWPKMPHFHHFSICNQTQSISHLVTLHQNTKAIACVFATNASFSSLFNLQSS